MTTLPLEIPDNILPLTEPDKFAAEFTKFFAARNGRSSNVSSGDAAAAKSDKIFGKNAQPVITSRGSPVSLLIGGGSEDIKSKLELLELNVPGKLEVGTGEGAGGGNHAQEESRKYGKALRPGKIGGFDDADSVLSSSSSGVWVAPESWAVIPALIQAAYLPRPLLDTAAGEMSAIRIFKMDSRYRSVSLSNLDNFFQLSVLLACPINTTAVEICGSLSQKYFPSLDASRYRLYVSHAGIGNNMM
jgi:hypothetical protein